MQSSVKRTLASERSNGRILERGDESLDTGISAQSCSDQCAQQIDHQPGVQRPPLLEGAHPTCHAVVKADDLAGGGVEAFAGLDRIALQEIANVQPGRKAVGELQNAKGGDDRGETGEIGDLRDVESASYLLTHSEA